jgi:hypothetical protein
LKEIISKASKVTHWARVRGGINYVDNLCTNLVADSEQKVSEDVQDIQNWEFDEYEIAEGIFPGEVYELPPNAVVIQSSEDGKLFAVSFE